MSQKVKRSERAAGTTETVSGMMEEEEEKRKRSESGYVSAKGVSAASAVCDDDEGANRSWRELFNPLWRLRDMHRSHPCFIRKSVRKDQFHLPFRLRLAAQKVISAVTKQQSQWHRHPLSQLKL